MLLVLTGKTASGKDTLIAKILEKYPNFRKVLTTTTRAPREAEVNGVDYNFISKEDFKKNLEQGDLLEYVEYGGNLYGTERPQINLTEDLIWKIDPSMAGKAKEMFKNSITLYITVDEGVVLERLKMRGLSRKEIEKRIQDDQKFWDEYQDRYDYVVENVPGQLDQTVAKITQIINASR